MRHLVEGTAHGVAGQGGGTAGVQLMHQVVEYPVVVQHILVVLGGDGDLVAQAPHEDGRVVIILDDQLLHLADCIFPAIRHMFGNIGNFRPDDHACLITQVVEILVMLVMGQTDGIGADLPDQGHVGIVVLLMQGISDALPVLMAADTPQGIAAAVEEKALLRIHMEIPGTETGGDRIHLLAVYRQHGLAGIEEGIFQSVPQVHIPNLDIRVGTLADGNRIALSVLNGDSDCAVLCVMPGANPDKSILTLDLRMNGDTRTAEIVQVKVVPVDNNQLHVPVDAAIEGEVRLLGVHPVVDGVVHLHGKVVLIFQKRRHIAAEGGVPAVVGHGHGTVHNDLRGGIHARKFQINTFVRTEFRCGKALFIDTFAPPVIISPVLTILIVPGMGNIYMMNTPRTTTKSPIAIQIIRLSHCIFDPHFLDTDLQISWLLCMKYIMFVMPQETPGASL